jgi:hypothetical protein
MTMHAGQTAETINHLVFEVLEHPAYSPYRAPSDYRLFGPPKDALRARSSRMNAWMLERLFNKK